MFVFVFVVCYVGRILCDKLITRSESPTGRRCVCVCVLNFAWEKILENIYSTVFVFLMRSIFLACIVVILCVFV